MGIRCTQLIGLKPRAKTYLDKNVRTIETTTDCPTCKKKGYTKEIKKKTCYDNSGSSGMFEDGPLLHEYELKNGKKIRVVVQCSPWSSGPCIFLCLELQNRKKKRLFEWTEKEIDQNL